jgi:hypothetical protein
MQYKIMLYLVAQTLKGNIRVFCRVRPLAPCSPDVEKLETGQPVLAFPPVGRSSLTFLACTALHNSCTRESMIVRIIITD